MTSHSWNILTFSRLQPNLHHVAVFKQRYRKFKNEILHDCYSKYQGIIDRLIPITDKLI